MATVAERRAEALARIPVRNAWRMLLYAWDLAAWRGLVSAEAESSTTLLGLLARVLEDCTRQLMHRQLTRAHNQRSEILRGIRGRIDFGSSLARLQFEAGRATCEFSELGIDTPRNRILRSTLYALARDPRVEHVDARASDQLRSRLARHVEAMAGVRLVRLASSDFSRLQLGRNDRDYAIPLAICELVHRLELPSEANGDHALLALCRDEIRFERLFETFVRNFYRLHLPDHTVSSEVLDWDDQLACDLAPAMRTDITITERAPPHRRLVVDTKFSSTTLSVGRHGTERLKSHNLYQLYAYLRTQEHRGESFRTASGLLLYPKTSHELDTEMLVQGHRIRAATVDLGVDWDAVEVRLLEVMR